MCGRTLYRNLNGITVLAEDAGLDDSKVKLHGVTDAQITNNIEHVLEEFEDIMDGSVGCYVGGAVKIEIEEGGSV